MQRLTISPYPNDEDWDGVHWELRTDYEIDGRTIHKTFVFDGRTIPPPFWPIVGHPMGKGLFFGLYHDYLLETGWFSRTQCGLMALKAFRGRGVSGFRKITTYTGTRLGDFWSWLKQKVRRKEKKIVTKN